MINISKVINKLVELTKVHSIDWYYLSEHSILSEKSIEILGDNFSDNTSFYTKINDGYFVLFEDCISNLYLILYPSLDAKDVQCLNVTNGLPIYQQDLLRLQNLTKKLFPNVEDFLDSFIND